MARRKKDQEVARYTTDQAKAFLAQLSCPKNRNTATMLVVGVIVVVIVTAMLL